MAAAFGLLKLSSSYSSTFCMPYNLDAVSVDDGRVVTYFQRSLKLQLCIESALVYFLQICQRLNLT